MMNSSTAPPQTYQEWLHCFDEMLSNKRLDVRERERLSRGRLQGDELTLERFQRQLASLLHSILDKKRKQLTRSLNLLLECNEVEAVPMLVRRFKMDMHHYLFFDELEFLSEQARKQLGHSFKVNVSLIVQEVVSHLEQQIKDHNDSDLEDIIYLMKRMKPLP